MKKSVTMNRRQFMAFTGMLGAGLIFPGDAFASSEQIHKAIPKTDEKLPVIGMGTSRTFDANGNIELLARLQQVTQTFFDMGGGLIDSSPMYGSAQKVIGQLLRDVKAENRLFAATKVWIDGKKEGIDQMEQSRRQWGIRRFDLMQIHNLIDWETHLETLKQMKSDGAIRYIGITTSHGRNHQQLENILRHHDIDFVQLSYNIGNRSVESSLLPISQEKGVAVIVNRPYQRGDLFHKVKEKSLPAWAKEFDCYSWGQYFLKFVVSHPAVTCAIPATTSVKHMRDNMTAGTGRMPTAKQRLQMVRYFESL